MTTTTKAPRAAARAKAKPSAEATAVAAAVEPSPPAAALQVRATKLDLLIALLRREEGATVAQMQAATGWQPHSVRGALTAAVKRRHGLPLSSAPGSEGRVYRIAAPGAEG